MTVDKSPGHQGLRTGLIDSYVYAAFTEIERDTE